MGMKKVCSAQSEFEIFESKMETKHTKEITAWSKDFIKAFNHRWPSSVHSARTRDCFCYARAKGLNRYVLCSSKTQESAYCQGENKARRKKSLWLRAGTAVVGQEARIPSNYISIQSDLSGG
jgi:hypothetical protein